MNAIELSFYELICEIVVRKVRPHDKLVLVVLATTLRKNIDEYTIDNECHETIKKLMLETGLPRKKVIQSLKNLESIGLLQIKRRCELNDTTPIYSINLSAGGWCYDC